MLFLRLGLGRVRVRVGVRMRILGDQELSLAALFY